MPEPLSSFFSTHLNSKINSIPALATRNLRFLGCPLINLEIAQDMAYEAIAKSIELYTQYTEPEKHFLLFDSTLYKPGYGIKMDNLFSATPELTATVDFSDPDSIQIGRDIDLQDYRRVIDVINIEEGESQGTNILFSMQYAMMQQLGVLFYSGGMAKGFDLITWYNANEFLELRNKMLALKSYFRFDPHTQIMRIIPEPKKTARYYALVECAVEPRIRDCLKNHFVQMHSLARMKYMIGSVRGKYQGVNLLGNGSINYTELKQEGTQEIEKLEQQLLEGTGGFANAAPPIFIVQ